MPCADIDYSEAHRVLNGQVHESPEGCFVSTPFGLSLLEIQGELNLPTHAPTDTQNPDPEYKANFATVDEIYEAVRFGNIQFDEKDPAKVVLIIGKSQRLMGSVVTLPKPLGVLRVPSGEEAPMKIIDVIYKKLLFKQRPLPIM